MQWNANTETDLAGYNLYSALSPTGPFTKLNTTLLTTLTYNDATAIPGQTTYYELTAVDTLNHESAPATANAAVPATSGFVSADIGGASPAGVTTVVTPGTDYDVQAGGFNIDLNSDQFRFVYEQLTGNFDDQGRASPASPTRGGGTSSFARAGLMARTDLTVRQRQRLRLRHARPQRLLRFLPPLRRRHHHPHPGARQHRH